MTNQEAIDAALADVVADVTVEDHTGVTVPTIPTGDEDEVSSEEEEVSSDEGACSEGGAGDGSNTVDPDSNSCDTDSDGFKPFIPMIPE